MTDGQLLADYVSRREEAVFAVLVERHASMVWGVCRRVLNDHHDVEDAFQATFLVLVRKAASIASRELLANWLYGVARQTALRMRARAKRRRECERQVTDVLEPVVAERDLWHDLQPVLDEELGRLPQKYRSVIVLCDLEGRTRREAARHLGVPEGTVGGWLARARAMLGKRLALRGLTVSAAVMETLLAQNRTLAGVPPAVVSNTIKAASRLAAGLRGRSGGTSGPPDALTKGVRKTMLWTKLKIAAAVLLALAAITSGIGISFHRVEAANWKAVEDPPVKEEKKTDAKVDLKAGRLSAAKKAFGAVWGDYQRGLHDEELVYRWAVRLLEAQRAGATHAEQIKAFEAHLDRMKKLEKLAPERMVMVPVERFNMLAGGKPGLGVGVTKDGNRVAMVVELGTRPPHGEETTAFYTAEAEVWLDEIKNKKATDK
jgi:RNA polymerase sigma factor (sigma-70 family)